MTVIELEELLRTTVLTDLLGTYTDSQGTIHEAIIIGGKTPPGLTVQGLECVIHPTPRDFDLYREFSSSGATKYYDVVLKNWNDNQDLEYAILDLMSHFENLNPPTVVGPTEDLIEQATFKIPFSISLGG